MSSIEDKEIKERGLSRILVENGFDDVKVKIGDKLIPSVKSVLVSRNETLKKLIQDEKFVGYIELYEECGEIGFYEMEKYYSGGNLKICKENVCEILMFSLCYKDDYVINNCNSYLRSNIDDDIMIKLIHMSNIFPNGLKEIEQEMMIEFEKRGYKYLYNSDYLMKLEVNNMKMLLCFKNVIIKNEMWLLNRLVEWYKFKINNSNYDDNNVFMNDFKCLIEKYIDGKNIKDGELRDESKEIIKKLEVKFNKNVEVKYIDLCKIKDENIQNIVINKYLKSDEVEFNKEEKEKINRLKEEELTEITKLLLEMNNMMIEIAIMIIIYKDMKIKGFISNVNQRDMISKMCIEYNENKRNRTMKCLSIFVNDKKVISTIKSLCGNSILFRLLNEDGYLKSELKSLLIEYIQEINLSKEEEEEMNKIILNEETIKQIKTKEITLFKYPQKKYKFDYDEKFSIIPKFNGTMCEFSVNPSLPLGITINKENGIISGEIKEGCENKKYEITCKNSRSERKFKLSLGFDIKFTEKHRTEGMLISEGGKKIQNKLEDCRHVYLNMKLEHGVYHIKFRFRENAELQRRFQHFDYMELGISTDNTYEGDSIDEFDDTSCYSAFDNQYYEYTTCSLGKIVNKPNFYHDDNSIYEMIIDMDKREFWISHNNSKPVLYLKDLPSPLFPYGRLRSECTSLEIIDNDDEEEDSDDDGNEEDCGNDDMEED